MMPLSVLVRLVVPLLGTPLQDMEKESLLRDFYFYDFCQTLC